MNNEQINWLRKADSIQSQKRLLCEILDKLFEDNIKFSDETYKYAVELDAKLRNLLEELSRQEKDHDDNRLTIFPRNYSEDFDSEADLSDIG